MARKPFTVRLVRIKTNEDGTRAIVEVGDGYTAEERKVANADLHDYRADAKGAGTNPYDIVLLPDGPGGPYLPLDVKRDVQRQVE